MIRFIGIKTMLLPVTVFTVSLIVFSITHLLPGDPVLAFLGDQATPDVVEAHRERLGLNDPFVEQYARYIVNALRGDLGASPVTGQSVSDAIWQRLPLSVELLTLAMVLGVVIGVFCGIIAAAYRNTNIDLAISLVAIGGVAMPSFYLGALFILLFTLQLGWLPPSGYVPFTKDPIENLKHMVLPSFTLALSIAPVIMRQTRASMVEILRLDFIRTARAKGLSERAVLGSHALRNAWLPVITVVGLVASRLFGGAVIVETVFALPGLGRLSVDSIVRRDYLTLQAVVILIAFAVVVVNTLTDLIYGFVDPRVGKGGA